MVDWNLDTGASTTVAVETRQENSQEGLESIIQNLHGKPDR